MHLRFASLPKLTLAILPALLLPMLLRAQPGASGPALHSLSPPVLLPDGTEFKTWEAPLRFTKTYYVDAKHPAASDENPGTPDRPFATIHRAAQVLQPGERVVVAAGVYRERIQPARGGSGPEALISYEAAPGAEVILKGSRVFREPWTRVEPAGDAVVWEAGLAPKYFDGYNPFAIDNVTPKQFESMDWATPLRGKPPFTLPRGLVFQNGRLLTRVTNRADVSAREGSYWVDRTNGTLRVQLFGRTPPDKALLEITTQETVLAPEAVGLGYIRVAGFTVEQVAGPFPWEQVGAISTTRGHHWLIESNTVRWVNGVGIDVGIQHPRWPQPELSGFHIVRRNTITDCGICGIAGLGPGTREFGLLIEENVLRGNAFHDVERLFETAAIKTHVNVRCLIRRNLIVDTFHGAGIWMDWDNRNSRCCQNVIVGAHTMHGGIFVEASQVPNLVDRNFVWDTEGHGIYEHDSCRQIFVHNFVGRSTRSGFHLHGKITPRRIAGKQPEYGGHLVKNNLLFANAQPDEYRGEPSEVTDNLARNLGAVLDRRTWQLALWMTNAPSGVVRLPFMTHDFQDRPLRGDRIVPGPWGELPDTASLRLWPVR